MFKVVVVAVGDDILRWVEKLVGGGWEVVEV